MTTAFYIALVAVAGVISLFALLPALIVLSAAAALAWRHELRATSANLPHSLILRG